MMKCEWEEEWFWREEWFVQNYSQERKMSELYSRQFRLKV